MNMKDVIVPASVAAAALILSPAASAQELLIRGSLVKQSSASHLEAGPMGALRLSGAISASLAVLARYSKGSP